LQVKSNANNIRLFINAMKGYINRHPGPIYLFADAYFRKVQPADGTASRQLNDLQGAAVLAIVFKPVVRVYLQSLLFSKRFCGTCTALALFLYQLHY
jgi:hypothetical protein